MTPIKWSVLIVDDDPQFGRLVASVAENCNFDTRIASSARQAWLALEPAPTLILLDLNMPDADGIEVLRELAFRRCGAQIRVFSGADPRVLRSAVLIGRDLGLRIGEPLSKPLPVARMREVFAEAAQAAATALTAPTTASPAPPVTVDELRLALTRSELSVVYQPILNLTTLSPVGAEALVRWRHPTRGILAPGSFLPLAESSGLVVELTEQVFSHALEFCGRPDYAWEGRALAISVNLSTSALVERQLVELISSLLAASGIAPARLIAEVTETAVGGDRASVLEVLSRLRLRGIELSIDDFGTGASSLERLHQLPFTELKIERAFVDEVLRRPQAATIVRSTLELGRRLDLRVVAEGIENAPTLRWLRKAGCTTGQGFLFSRGLPDNEFMTWLAEWRERRAPLLGSASPRGKPAIGSPGRAGFEADR